MARIKKSQNLLLSFMGRATRAKATKPGVNKSTGIAKDSQISKLDQLRSIIATEPASRGKRKRALKRARIESRNEFVSSALKSKNLADSKSSFGIALGDFGDLTAVVENGETDDHHEEPVTVVKNTKKVKGLCGALKRNQKARSDALDVHRFHSLMEIPDFANDPMAAIEKHLLNQKKKREQKLANKPTSAMDMSS